MLHCHWESRRPVSPSVWGVVMDAFRGRSLWYPTGCVPQACLKQVWWWALSSSFGCESDMWGVSLEFLLFIPICFLLVILCNSLVSWCNSNGIKLEHFKNYVINCDQLQLQWLIIMIPGGKSGVCWWGFVPTRYQDRHLLAGIAAEAPGLPDWLWLLGCLLGITPLLGMQRKAMTDQKRKVCFRMRLI